MKKPWLFIITAFLLAAAFDMLFWGKPVGISFLIWVVLALIGAVFLSIVENKRPVVGTWVLMGLCIALAGMSVLRQEPFTRTTNSLLSLACIFILAATYLSGRWLTYNIGEAIVSGARTLWAGFSRAAKLPGQIALTRTHNENGTRSTRKSAGPVVRGVLLAAPVVLVLGALLSSADMVFAHRLGEFFKLFEISNWAEILFRLMYVLIFTYIFAGLYLHAIHPAQRNTEADQKEAPVRPFLGHIEAFIVLGSVDLLFLVFVIIQFEYLFGGKTNIHQMGFSYSQYARRGFGELVIVAGLSFLLYFVLTGITRTETKLRKRIFSGLSVGLMGLVVVILASALDRVLLYESAYGFSRIRTYTHVLIIWMAVTLLVAIMLELIGRRQFLPQTMLLAGLCFVLSLGILNVDGYIVQRNVQRTLKSATLDTDYLHTLSNDAVPELFAQFNNSKLSPNIHDKLGIELSCRAYALSQAKPKPWQSFDWTDYRTNTLSQQHQAALQPYNIRNSLYDDFPFVQLHDQKYYCKFNNSD